jgi:3-oxoacyl-[acyl-carrier-protein] synthase III
MASMTGNSTPGKMLIESLGVYLPSSVVSTDEILSGCKVALKFPLERVTGIQYRHVAGDNEFSVDLARHAILDCLNRSRHAPEEIDLIISCDTSHSTGFLEHSAEPSTALKLQRDFGLTNALAFDVTNACAGVFTALLIVQSLLETGAIHTALVVSGEHITHLVRTAQLEIENFRDPRLACLTLGDAGVAMILQRSLHGSAGFEAINLETLGQHSSLCIGKQTDRSHGGAIMLTQSGELARIAIEESVNRTLGALRSYGWFPAAFQHFIMHQTAKVAVDEVVKVLNRKAGQNVLHSRNTINNLQRRGNTATTTHFVALMDHVRAGRIESGQRVLFGIAASGITSGTALYTLDDLPDRVRGSTKPQTTANGKNGSAAPKPRTVKVESVGLLSAENQVPRNAIAMLTAAARSTLAVSRYDRNEIDLTINAGVYRNEFLCEPAVAALVAGNLLDDNLAPPPGTGGMLAFDLTNGSLGVLEACYVAANMIRSEKIHTALVLAAEIEVNRGPGPQRSLGLEETGSGLILDDSAHDGPGFGTFLFQSFTRHSHSFTSHSAVTDGRTVLSFERSAGYEDACLTCIVEMVERLLHQEGLDRRDISVVLPPLPSRAFVLRLADKLGLPIDRMVYPPAGAKDLYTSSLAFALHEIGHHHRTRAGDIGLIIGVGSGIQVGCATYYF